VRSGYYRYDFRTYDVCEGDEVSVDLDVERDESVIAPVPLAAACVDERFARQVAQFIDAYRPALEAISR
jgi:hypothetical protein